MHQRSEILPQVFYWNERAIQLLRTPRLKSYKIFIYPNMTIQMKIPAGWSHDKIHGALKEHTSWIETCLKKSLSLQKKFKPFTITEGEFFLLLGQPHALKFQKSSSPVVSVRAEQQQLIVSIPVKDWFEGFANHPHPRLRSHILKFYDLKAQQLLVPTFWRTVEQMGYGPKKLVLRNQRTLWGSCSRHNSTIQLNKKLIAAPMSVLEYVMIHELAHLKHPNHGKGFWAEVERNCLNYKQLRGWLRKNHHAFSFFEEVSELFACEL